METTTNNLVQSPQNVGKSRKPIILKVVGSEHVRMLVPCILSIRAVCLPRELKTNIQRYTKKKVVLTGDKGGDTCEVGRFITFQQNP